LRGGFGSEERWQNIVEQAKLYSNNVSLDAIQEVVAAKACYHADEAWR